MKPKNPSVLSWILALTAGATLAAHATTYNWVGTTNGAWHVNTNWNGGVTPTFDNQADIKYGVNTPVTTFATWLSTGDRTVRSLEFANLATATTLALGSDAATNTARTLTLAADSGAATITVASTVSANVTIGSSTGTSRGSITLASDLVVTNNSATSILPFPRPIGESGGSRSITKNGVGLVSLGVGNTFTGTVTVNGGALRINLDDRLGTPPATPVPDQLTLDGGSLLTNAPSAFSLNSNRGITLGAGGGTLEITNGGSVSYGGTITGAGSLVKQGANDLNLEAASSYLGATTINNGVLRLQASGSIPAATNITINSGSATGNFNVRNSIGWVHTGTITGDGTGQINLNSGTDATLAGPISGVLNINGNSAGTDATISGDISGVAIVNVQSAGGILTLSGTNTYSGASNVANNGTLIINGDNSGATGAVTVNAGGTLAGSGTIGSATTIIGTHSPGDGPGVQTFNAGIDYAAGSNLSINLWTNSSAPGVRGVNPLGYSGVDVTAGVLNIDAAANGHVALDTTTGNVNLADAFWNSPQSWLAVDVKGTATAGDTNVPTLGGVSINGNAFNAAAYGTFSFSRAGDDVVLEWTPSTVPTWTGASSGSWGASNWTITPGTGDIVRFGSPSISNLTTTLGADYDLLGLAVINPNGPVSIGGTNSLTLGSGGIDLSFATQNLTITAPVILSESQNWNVASGRTLSVNGGVSGTAALGIGGGGTVSLGAAVGPLVDLSVSPGATLKMAASNILSNDPLASAVGVNGTLDLNGTTQSINGLSGNGILDNTAAGAALLTLGNNDVAITFSGTIQNSNGTLALVKTGSGNLILSGANSFSGGFTNNGSGNVVPQNDAAFGTGPVVSNAGTIYPTSKRTYANSLALNDSTLRIGGGSSNYVIWNGPVTATGNSGISADNGTVGITLTNTLNIAGATFTSTGNVVTHNIDGVISGAGGNLVVNGIGSSATLQLSGANTYDGSTTITGSGVLRLQPTGTISSATNVTINDTGNFNIRNTVGWVYTGTISGAGTGSINLNSGTNAELAGDISGVAVINVGSAETDATLSGDISGGNSVNVQNGGNTILHLAGNNSYSGNTTIANTATLILESPNALPDASPVSIANGTLNATVSGTDFTGTLDVTNAATINLAADAKLAFADSNAVDWTGGSLDITGTFVSGSSLRFGTDANGLTATQLGLITSTGFSTFALDANGFLTATSTGGYSTWALTNATGQTPDEDFDGDGVTNGVEYVVGGTAATKDLGKLPTVSSVGGNFVFTFQRDQSSTDALTQIEVGTTLAAWPTVLTVLDNLSAQEPGVTVVNNPANPGFDTVTLSINQALSPKNFARLKVTP